MGWVHLLLKFPTDLRGIYWLGFVSGQCLFDRNDVLEPTKDADPGNWPTWQNYSHHKLTSAVAANCYCCPPFIHMAF